MSLLSARCFNHGGREAVARCPLCGNCFCRECVTDHDGKAVCSRCLASMSSGPTGKGKIRGAVLRGLSVAVGFLLLWLLFYEGGRLLLLIPTSFHDGTIWEGLAGR